MNDLLLGEAYHLASGNEMSALNHVDSCEDITVSTLTEVGYSSDSSFGSPVDPLRIV